MIHWKATAREQKLKTRTLTGEEKQGLVLVVHEMNHDLMGLLQQLSAGGLSMIVYIVTDENMEQVIRQGNSRLKFFAIPIEADLEEIL